MRLSHSSSFAIFFCIRRMVQLTIFFSVISEARRIKGPVVYQPASICEQLTWNAGWFSCESMICLEGLYSLWPTFKSVQKQCFDQCQAGTFGIHCRYGDVYSTGKNGVMLNLSCQCSGESSPQTCERRKIQASDLLPMKKTELDYQKACANWCKDGQEMALADSHCSLSALKPEISNLPIANWTCTCESALATKQPTLLPTPHPHANSSSAISGIRNNTFE